MPPDYDDIAITPAKSQPEPGIKEGLAAAVPIALSYLPVGITFGLVAKAAAIPDHIIILMSLLIYAGAAQFIGVNLIALGTGPGEIILTTFMINLRHLLMSASLSRRVSSGASRRLLAGLAFGITDETFTVASLRPEEKIKPGFLLGLNGLAFLAWVLSTVLGLVLVSGVPGPIKASMGIAFYALFIGLLVPSLRRSFKVATVVVLAAAIHALLYWTSLGAGLSSGWRIIITTMAAALAGAVLFPQGVNEK